MKFVGKGAQPYYDRNTGLLKGYVSKDGTKRYRVFDSKKGSANFETYDSNGKLKKNVHIKIK